MVREFLYDIESFGDVKISQRVKDAINSMCDENFMKGAILDVTFRHEDLPHNKLVYVRLVEGEKIKISLVDESVVSSMYS